jgi:hypothetical protein
VSLRREDLIDQAGTLAPDELGEVDDLLRLLPGA